MRRPRHDASGGPRDQKYFLNFQHFFFCFQFCQHYQNRHTFGDFDFGNKKRDSFYLVLDGLDDIDFGNKKRNTCLQRVQGGVMHVANETNAETNWSECAAMDKDLGW